MCVNKLAKWKSLALEYKTTLTNINSRRILCRKEILAYKCAIYFNSYMRKCTLREYITEFYSEKILIVLTKVHVNQPFKITYLFFWSRNYRDDLPTEQCGT